MAESSGNARRWIWPAIVVAVALAILWFGRDKPGATPAGRTPTPEADALQPVLVPDAPLPAETEMRAAPSGEAAKKAEPPAEPSLAEQAHKPLVIVKTVAPGAARGIQGNLDKIDAARQRQNDAVNDLEE